MVELRATINTTGMVTGLRSADAALSKSAAQARRFDSALERTEKQTTRLGGALKATVQQFGPLLAGFGAAAAVRGATSAIASFEEALLTVRGVAISTNETLTDLQQGAFTALQETAKELGATTRFSATEVGQGLLFLARAGLTAEEAIAAIPATLDLAIAGQLGLAEASDVATNIAAAFGLQAADTARVVDSLAVTANSANTSVADLAQAMKFVAPVAGSLGIDVEDAAAAIGVLGNNGIQASMAGTNLRQALLSLIAPSSEGAAVLADYGLTLDDVNPKTNSLVDVFDRLGPLLEDTAAASQVFNVRALGGALVVGRNVEELENLIQKQREGVGTGERLRKVIDSGLAGSFRSLISATEALFISFGDAGLGGALQEAVDFATQVVRALSGLRGEANDVTPAAERLADAISLASKAFVAFVATSAVRYLGGLVASTALAAGGMVRYAASTATATVATRGFGAAVLAAPFGPLIAGLSQAIGLVVVFQDEITEGLLALDANVQANKRAQENYRQLTAELDKANTRFRAINVQIAESGTELQQLVTNSENAGAELRRVVDDLERLSRAVTLDERQQELARIGDVVAEQQGRIAQASTELSRDTAAARAEVERLTAAYDAEVVQLRAVQAELALLQEAGRAGQDLGSLFAGDTVNRISDLEQALQAAGVEGRDAGTILVELDRLFLTTGEGALSLSDRFQRLRVLAEGSGTAVENLRAALDSARDGLAQLEAAESRGLQEAAEALDTFAESQERAVDQKFLRQFEDAVVAVDLERQALTEGNQTFEDRARVAEAARLAELAYGEGTDAARIAAQAFEQQLNDLRQAQAVQSLEAFTDGLREQVLALEEGAAAARRFREERELEALAGAIENEGEREEALRVANELIARRTQLEAEQTGAVERGTAAERQRLRAEERAEQLRLGSVQSIAERIEALRDEAQLVGLSEEQQRRVRVVAEAAADARKAYGEDEQAVADAIRDTVQAYNELVEAENRVSNAQERRDLDGQINALAAQRVSLGQSADETERLAFTTQLAAAAARAYPDSIEAQNQAVRRGTDEFDKLQQKMKEVALNDAIRSGLEDLGQTAVKGLAESFLDAATGAESLGDSLGGLLQSLSDLALQTALNVGVQSLFSGFASGGAIGPGASLTGLANGGVVNEQFVGFSASGQGVTIGEAGAEIVMPAVRGPNGQVGVQAFGGGGGGGTTIVNQYISTPDADSFNRSQRQNAALAKREFGNASDN